MLLEKEKRVFKWSFDFPPFMGTKFDFIAYNRPSPHRWYGKKTRNKHRERARDLFDALDDGLGAEIGLLRKPKKFGKRTRVIHPKPGSGASRFDLRNALESRVRGITTEQALRHFYPSKTLKTATADELFNTLYAVAWSQDWGRGLHEWQGMMTGKAA